MDSIDRFVKKIEIVQESPNFQNLKNLISDLWAWSDQYETTKKSVQDMANEIEIVIAMRLDEDMPLSNEDLDQIRKTLSLIKNKLKTFVS